MNNPKTHTVCVVGAAADVATRIIHVLDEQRVKLTSRWRAGDHATADLLIIDADSVYGHMDWLKANSSGRLVAAFTQSTETDDAGFSLRHAFVAADLVALLNRVALHLDGSAKPAALAATAKAPPPAAPIATAATASAPTAPAPIMPVPLRTSTEAVSLVTSLRKRPTLESLARPAEKPVAAVSNPSIVTPPPPSRAPVEVQTTAPVQAPPPKPRGIELLDLLEQDSPLKGRLRLAADGLPTLLLDPTERTWFSASGLKGLSVWATRTLSADDVHHADEKEFITDMATLQGHPYARLQWLAHLVRGDGELATSLDPDARYKLARWPQSEREFPRHFRIATVMLKQSGTPGEIAELGGATAADVANFINAYHALGYIEQESVERAAEASTRTGLFGRMRKTSANIG